AEPGAEHEAQVVEGSKPAVQVRSVEPVAICRLLQRAQVFLPERLELGAREGAVLPLDLLVLVGGGAKPAERGVFGLRREELLELRGQPAEQIALVGAQADDEIAVRGAFD